MQDQHTKTTSRAASARPLDPVENISTQPAEKRQKGHFRRQMIATPRNGIWGTENGSCGLQTLARRREDGAIILAPALCDSWACGLCGPRKAAWFKRELAAAQSRHKLDTFMTLTVDAKSCSAEESARLITRWWDALHMRLQRARGRFSYIWAHDFLTSLELQSSELSGLWRSITGSSFIVDVQPISNERAADYLAKYCTEQATLRGQAEYRHMRGRRFYSTSRDIHFAPFRGQPAELAGDTAWRRLDVPYREMVSRLRAKGAAPIERLSVVPGCTIAAGDYELAALLGGST
jgi:hypothetical protein